MRVDIGVACNKNQSSKWWAPLWVESLSIERRGFVQIGRLWPVGSALTDYNRNEVVDRYEVQDPVADALWFIDDDTVPPGGALEHLVDLMQAAGDDVGIVAGIYYSRSEPYNPVCYKRLSNQGYVALARFQVGEIVEPDSTGMGCTLIRREVFEEIRRQYKIFRRLRTGTVFPVHVDDVWDEELALARMDIMHEAAGKLVQGPGRGYLVDPVVGPVSDFERWPFFAFEYGRTEDHPFCEMALRCGFRILVDTALECRHVGEDERASADFFENMDALESWMRLKWEMGQ